MRTADREDSFLVQQQISGHKTAIARVGVSLMEMRLHADTWWALQTPSEWNRHTFEWQLDCYEQTNTPFCKAMLCVLCANEPQVNVNVRQRHCEG